LGGVLAEVQKRNEINRLLTKKDMAEAFNYAYIGSKPSKIGGNPSAFHAWLTGIERRIAKLQGQILDTAWGKITKSRKLGR
jgi:hypothetical protein